MSVLTALIYFLVTVLILVFGGVYLFFQKKYKYWSDKGIPHAKPSFPFGNFQNAGVTKNVAVVFREIYDRFKGEKFAGFWVFHRPTLLVRDPELIKNILVRDFMHFHDRGSYANEKDDPLSAHLVSLKGAHWRNHRVKLTPIFTSGKMKMMLPIMTECGKLLEEVLEGPASRGEVIDVKEIIGRFGTDVISSVAFGIQTNSLTNPNAEFRLKGKKVFQPDFVTTMKNLLAFFTPDIAEMLKLIVTPKDVSEFFIRVFKETVEYREKNNVRRNDLLQLLIQLMKEGIIDDVDSDRSRRNEDGAKETTKFTLEEATAEAFVFFVGGFETSSTLSQFILYELSLHPDIQKRVRDEIHQVMARHNNQITYEGLQEMTYMKCVIDETLRKYPPGTLLPRVCTKTYKIPNTDVIIDPGTQILIVPYGLHWDPEHFPNPEKFDPERFANTDKFSDNYNYTYLPFGEGPRFCIGQRFALLQTKMALVSMLSKFSFSVTKETPIPLELNPKSFIIDVKNALNLKITKV